MADSKSVVQKPVVRPRGCVDIDQDRCKGCGLCVEVCPKKLLVLSNGNVNAHGYAYVSAIENDTCTGCASCGIICPDACITVYRK